jgi:cation diffusion facilitator family transporter
MLAIIVKEVLYQYVNLRGRQLSSTALMAEAWHHRSDAISSVAALIGVAGAQLGYPAFDAIAGIAVAVLIGHMGVKLYIQSVRELIDEAPDEAVVEGIKAAALGTAGVLDVNEVKARQMGPGVLVDLKLCVNRFLTVEEGHDIAAEVKKNILEAVKEVDNVLVHVNPCHHVNSLEQIPICDDCGNEPHRGHEEEVLDAEHYTRPNDRPTDR